MLVQETPVQTSQPAVVDRPVPAELRRSEARAPQRSKVDETQARNNPEASETGESPAQQDAEKSSRARLSLDPELHRVFVEIVDPKTGDVITRFPPEQIADHIDSVLEQTDQGTNLENSGLIVDESV